MKKMISVFLNLVLVLSCFTGMGLPAKADGLPEGLEYSVSNGEVTITGYTGSATELEIPATIEGYPVISIGYGAFMGHSDLASIEIPDSITDIGESAFWGCHSLTRITIPDSVTVIEDCAFGSCKSLMGIWVDENNPNYSSDKFGALLDKEQKKLIKVPNAITGIYKVPDGVISICDRALEYCSNLTNVIIPDSVISIGGIAFAHCSSIVSVTVGKGVTDIAADAFYNCWELTGIWFSEDNPNFSNDKKGIVFNKNKTELILVPQGISGNYNISQGVTKIGYAAFSGCNKLTGITIPESVTSIGGWAFGFCANLTQIIFKGNAPVCDSYAFKTAEITANYPKDNDTWTEEVMQDYGGNITWVPYEPYEPGDLDGVEGVDNRDVEFLLWHTLFPEDYPLPQSADFDCDGVVDNKDVEYLLWHTLFPEDYPL